MPTEIGLGNVAGLRLTAEPSAIAGSLGLWGLLSGVAARVLAVPPGAAAVAGLIAVGLHWASALVHQLGHARAARRTGHPMAGIRCFALLSASLYPPDEPPLPGAVACSAARMVMVAPALLYFAALSTYWVNNATMSPRSQLSERSSRERAMFTVICES